MSFANFRPLDEISSSRSFMYMMKKFGPRTVPCGMPLITFASDEKVPFTTTC